MPQIVDAVKKGLSEFSTSTQISDTLQPDQEDEFNLSGKCYISFDSAILSMLNWNCEFP